MELEGWWVRLGRGRWILDCPSHPVPCAHRVPSSRGGPQTVRGHDGPAAWRVRNLNHLWGRLRDFYQVRGWGGKAQPQPCGKASLLSPCPLCPQEELQLLILSPPPDLQTLGFDPFSGALSHHPFLLLPSPPTPNFLWLVLSRGGSGGVGGHPSAVAGGVSAGEQGRGGEHSALVAEVGETPCQPVHPVSLQCEHRELFIRHIQGLSLEVQGELAAAIQEVLGAGPQPGAGPATWGHSLLNLNRCSLPGPGDPAWGRCGAGAGWAGAWGAGVPGAGGAVPEPDGDIVKAGAGARCGGPGRGPRQQLEDLEDPGDPDVRGHGGWGQMWDWCGVLEQHQTGGGGHGLGYFWLLTLDFPQRLAELLLERQASPLLPETPARTPPEAPSHHLGLQLANTKAQLRRLRQEL